MKRRRQFAALRSTALEFCLLTGLHGCKYIAQPGKHGVERFFWLLAVAVSVLASAYCMVWAYDFNRAHQTLLAIDTTHYPLWAVAAPAVTVCPSNKVLASRARRLARAMILPEDVTEEEIVADMAYLVELIVPRASNASRFARLQQVLDQNGMSVDDVMFSVSPSCDEMLVMCRWKRQRCAQCSDLFRKVRTAYGYCCSFNYADRELDSITWRPRSRGCVGPTVPVVHRTSSCGFTNGLSVAVHVKPGEYFSSLVPSYSVMVLIHSAMQFPDESAHTKVIGTGTVALISYIAEVTEGTNRLRNTLSPHDRKCKFPDETYLPMYRNFTFGNCMASCKANITIDVCHCVPFTFPLVLNRTVCNLMDVPCQTALFSPESGQPLSIARCHLCGTLCEHVKYIVKSSAGALNWSTDPGNFFVSSRHPGRRNASEYAVVHVYARRSIVTRNKMDLHLQREDLLGALGGLSGLFVGFSLVAGFECLYFFTIRPCFRDGHGHTMMAGKRDGVAHEKQSSKTEDALITVPGIGRISPLITAPPRIFTLSKPHRRGRRHGFLAH